MMIRYSIFVLLSMCLWLEGVWGQEGTFSMQSFESGARRYHLIYAAEGAQPPRGLVVFLHGYGASNPLCYGGWIRAIVQEGYVVLFPQFQWGTFLPHTRKYLRRVEQNIDSARVHLARLYPHMPEELCLVAHSIGGVIGANLAQSGKYEISGLMLVQPGHKWLKLGQAKDYQLLPETCRILCITGNRDKTAGTRFARHIMRSTPQIHPSNKLWLHQYGDKYQDHKISATHVAPVSIDRQLDSGNRNLIICGALALGKTDEVDQYAYWRLTRKFLAACRQPGPAYLPPLSEWTWMGQWGERPIRHLEVRRPF